MTRVENRSDFESGGVGRVQGNGKPVTILATLLVGVALLLSACSKASGPAGEQVQPGDPTDHERPQPVAAGPQPPPPTETSTPDAVPDLPVSPAPGALERLQIAPGDVVNRRGLFFMQVATGAIEGWVVSDYATGANFQVSPDNRWLAATASDTTYLADRTTGSVYRWPTEQVRLLVAQGERLLFADDEYLWLVGADLRPLRTLPLKPASPRAAFSRNGRTLALVNDGILYLVEAEAGPFREVGPVPTDVPTVEASQHRDELLVRAVRYTGAGAEYVVQRYSWQGKRLGELTMPDNKSWLSPDGSLVAWDQSLAGISSAVIISDANEIEPRFRLQGGDLCDPDLLHPYEVWLADGSGVIVKTEGGYRILTPAGEMIESPALTGIRGEPTPAPDRPDRFALGRTKVVDAAGNPVAATVLGPDANGTPGHLHPWGYTSDELRFTTIHNGHGGRCSYPPPLTAQAERPPFPSDVTVTVGLPADECLNLRAQPGLAGTVITCIPGGSRLTVTTDPPPPPPGMMRATPTVPHVDGDWWVHVRAPGGQQGWIAFEAGQLDWVPASESDPARAGNVPNASASSDPEQPPGMTSDCGHPVPRTGLPLPAARVQDLAFGGWVESGMCSFSVGTDYVEVLFWLPPNADESAVGKGLRLSSGVEPEEVTLQQLHDQSVLYVRLPPIPEERTDRVWLSGPWGEDGATVRLGFELHRRRRQPVGQGRSEPELVALDPESGGERKIGPVPVDLYAASLSPDGRWAMLVTAEPLAAPPLDVGRELVWVLNTANGELYRTPFRHSAWPMPVIWQTNRMILPFHHELQIWQLEQRQAVVRASNGEHWPAVSADGRYLAGMTLDFSRMNDEALTPVSVVVYDLKRDSEQVFLDAARKRTLGHGGPPRYRMAWAPGDGALIIEDFKLRDAERRAYDIRLLQLDPTTGATAPYSGTMPEAPSEPEWVAGPGDWAFHRGQPWGPVKVRAPDGTEREWGKGYVLGWDPVGHLLVVRWADADSARSRPRM